MSPVPGVHRPLGVTGIETPYGAKVIKASVIPVRAPSQSEARKIGERDGTRPQISACHFGNEPRSRAQPLMVKCKIGMVKPRENPLVEPAHPFEHLAPDDDRMGLRLDAPSRFNFADRLMPVPADKVLALAEMTSTKRASDIEIRSCSVDEQAVALWLEIDRVHGRGIAGFRRSKENVQPAVAHDDIVLDECDPLRFGTFGTEIAGLVGSKEAIFPHDADPTASGESVKGGGHRARRMTIHEDDAVAPIGSSKEGLESGRGLRPTVTCDHDDSCGRCGRHENKVNITAFVDVRLKPLRVSARISAV
jgi:hypothetical protein